jgi:hypothetical protein
VVATYTSDVAGRQLFALVLVVVTAAVSAGGALGVAAGSHLTNGQRRVFPAGSLHIGVQVRCSSTGITISARVAARGHAVSTVGDGLRGSATLTVKTLASGRVIASCE